MGAMRPEDFNFPVGSRPPLVCYCGGRVKIREAAEDRRHFFGCPKPKQEDWCTRVRGRFGGYLNEPGTWNEDMWRMAGMGQQVAFQTLMQSRENAKKKLEEANARVLAEVIAAGSGGGSASGLGGGPYGPAGAYAPRPPTPSPVPLMGGPPSPLGTIYPTLGELTTVVRPTPFLPAPPEESAASPVEPTPTPADECCCCKKRVGFLGNVAAMDVPGASKLLAKRYVSEVTRCEACRVHCSCSEHGCLSSIGTPPTLQWVCDCCREGTHGQSQPAAEGTPLAKQASALVGAALQSVGRVLTAGQMSETTPAAPPEVGEWMPGTFTGTYESSVLPAARMIVDDARPVVATGLRIPKTPYPAC